MPTLQRESYDAEADGMNRIVISAREILENFPGEYYNQLWMTVTIKLFQREIFSHLRFREGIIYEDEDIFPQMLHNAHKITIVPMHLYNYTLSDGSIMRSSFTAKRDMVLGIWHRHVEFFHKLNLLKSRDYYAVKYIYTMVDMYRITYSEHPELKSALEPYIKEFCKFKRFIRKNCQLSKMQKVLMAVFPAFPGVAIRLHKRKEVISWQHKANFTLLQVNWLNYLEYQ